MKIFYQIILFAVFLCPLFATQVAPKTLAELVVDADFIVEAKVVGVEMRDSDGKKVVDANAATGPGISNQLFLRVQIVKQGFVYPPKHAIPNEFLIPLWQRWHDTLANRIKQSVGESRIFLLQGKTFSPVYPANFDRKHSELANIKALLKKAEQDGADQPATAPESKLEGNEKPKQESEGRPQ